MMREMRKMFDFLTTMWSSSSLKTITIFNEYYFVFCFDFMLLQFPITIYELKLFNVFFFFFESFPNGLSWFTGKWKTSLFYSSLCHFIAFYFIFIFYYLKRNDKQNISFITMKMMNWKMKLFQQKKNSSHPIL